VLNAALDVFAEAGYAAASMSAIATRADISKSVLYDCFAGGKRELWHEVLCRVETDHATHFDSVRAASNSGRLEEDLAGALRGFLEFADTHPHAFRLVHGDAGTSDPELRAEVERVRGHTITLLRDHVVARSFLGYDPARSGEWFARIIVATAEELAQWAAREPQLPRHLYVELAARWLTEGLFVGTTEPVQAPSNIDGRHPGESPCGGIRLHEMGTQKFPPQGVSPPPWPLWTGGMDRARGQSGEERKRC